MSFTSALSPSPVAAAFAGIEWDPLNKLRLSEPEKATLRAAEANPLEYTLADRVEAAAYARVLLKVLAETAYPSGPSRVSQVKESLPDAEALQMLYTDAPGVVMHYSISRLYDIVVCLKEKTAKSSVSIATTFYNADGLLLDDWRPLLRVLHLGGSGDAFAQRGSAIILANILVEGCPSQRKRNDNVTLQHSSVEEPLQALVSWIASQLQSSSGASLGLVIPALMTLMTCPEARTMFQESGGIGYLSRHLKRRSQSQRSSSKNLHNAGASVQQLYELCFCMWTMTYECNDSEAVRTHFARDGAVAALVDLVAAAPREKVVRVATSALANLATCTANDAAEKKSSKKRIANASYFLTEMIGCGLIKSIDRMKERQWTDPDILQDLDLLYKLLHENFKEMTRWDVYKAEVESGHLEWGSTHTEAFFRENATRLEGKDGDFELLRMLVMLAAGDDDDVAAVACYDIGEFVRHYPNGRSIAKRLGAKDIVMQLIESDNEDLKRQALQCVSKIMVQNWASIQ